MRKVGRPPAHGETRSIELGHLQVRHDQVVPLPFKPITGWVHVTAVRAQARYEEGPRARIVVDDQDAPGGDTLVRQETPLTSNSETRQCDASKVPDPEPSAMRTYAFPPGAGVLCVTVQKVGITRGRSNRRREMTYCQAARQPHPRVIISAQKAQPKREDIGAGQRDRGVIRRRIGREPGSFTPCRGLLEPGGKVSDRCRGLSLQPGKRQ